jgi:hypothetical protein
MMPTAVRRPQHAPAPAIWRLRVVILLAILATLLAVPRAFASGHETLTGTATAQLHLVKANGARLIEEGPVTGALRGSARAELDLGAIFTAAFTIYTHTGSITGKGQANPHGAGRYESFSGSFQAIKGSGRYAHITGRAALYGVFDRRTDSVVIQTTGGKLTY